MSTSYSSIEDSFDLDLNYWNRKLQGVSPDKLAVDYTRPLIQNKKGAICNFTIDRQLLLKLKSLSEQEKVTIFEMLLSAFNVLLYRYSSQENITVGSILPVNKDIVHSLALHSNVDGNTRFNQLLQQVKQTTSNAFRKQSSGDEQKQGTAATTRNTETKFQAMFVLKSSGGIPVFESANLSVFPRTASRPDIILMLNEAEKSLEGTVNYLPENQSEENINRMLGHFTRILEEITLHPEKPIGALNMLTPEEMHELVYKFNQTITDYPRNKTVLDLFEARVLHSSGNKALILDEEEMTYQQLNDYSNKIAWALLSLGLRKGSNIGLLAGRGFQMIAGMLGILKAGGAYVPIDPQYPLDRQEYILKQSSVTLVVADDLYPLQETMDKSSYVHLPALCLDHYSCENPGIKTDANDLAYTIYTSGSTGRPKGVMIEHHSVVNLVQWVNKTFAVGKDDRLLFVTSMCFDLSVYDIFGILAAGGAIVIAGNNEVKDVTRLQEMLQKYEITFWDSVPTTLDYLIRELESGSKEYLQRSLKTVFLSGDWIPVDLPGRIKKYFPAANVISLGGATEGTVWSNYFPVQKTWEGWSSIPYGKPIDNNFFYILNEQLQPVPQGVAGELYIGGAGVARGYSNDREKTDYSFVKDPFHAETGGRMYRTGDLGRMLPEMQMEFIGRKDNQVKIRGFRVELGEIENVLSQCSLVRQVVVLAKNDNEGKKRLIGYIVPDGDYHANAIADYLKSKVPEYMIPALWIRLDSLPLTSNGKIDRKSLAEIEPAAIREESTARPANDLEIIFADAWQEVLGIEKIGTTENFFALGGHSLIAVQITGRIEKKTGRKLPLALFFKHPTIREQVSSLQQKVDDAAWKSLVPIKPSGSKMPLYIVHGDGLNVLNFKDLAESVDEEQPIFGLQARGLDGIEKPLDDIAEIARHYVSELIAHNPEGPYAVGGYSFGGYIAIEMSNQLRQMGKEVKMTAIFDTNAQNAEYFKNRRAKIAKTISLQIPKLFWFTKLFLRSPSTLINYQKGYLVKQLHKSGILKQPEAMGIYELINRINEKHYEAFRKYRIFPFDAGIDLFKSKYRINFVEDRQALGWKKYARKGVNIHLVPGDHKTMFESPHVKEFGQILQQALNKSVTGKNK